MCYEVINLLLINNETKQHLMEECDKIKHEEKNDAVLQE